MARSRDGLTPIAAAFVAFGMFWGSWAVAVTDIKVAFRSSDAAIGSILSVGVLAGAGGNAIAGWLAHRWGVRRTLTRGTALWALLLAIAVAVPERHDMLIPFAAVFASVIACGGGIDALMNVAAATDLAGRPGKLLRFHALFNAGALVGALAAGLAVDLGASWRWSWALVAFAGAGVVWAVAPRGVPAEGHAPVPEPVAPWVAIAQLRRDGLVLLGILLACTSLVEGGVDTWGVLYLRTALATGVLLGAGAYALGQGMAALTRGAGGPAIGRFGTKWGVVAGALLCAAGLALEATAPWSGPAAAGLALAAMGIAVTWPLLISEGAERSGKPVLGVTGMTSFGYLGIVAGPVVVGWIASSAGLRSGILALASLAAAVGLARTFRSRKPRPTAMRPAGRQATDLLQG